MVSDIDQQAQPSERLSPLRATAIVAAGAAATLILSVLTAKAYALMVGPTGVGLLALMHSTLVVGVMVASGGLATSAVRAMSTAAAAAGEAVRTVEVSASRIAIIGGIVGAVVLIALREPFADVVLGSPALSGTVVILAVALVLAVAASVQIALLTGLHRVRQVVVVNVVTGLSAAAFGILLVAALGEDGLVIAVLATAAVQFTLSRRLLTRTVRRFESEGGPVPMPASAREMLAAGLPVAAGQLAGSGALFLVPILVLQVLDTADVGQYRAAAAISIGYLTFFLAALTQDYYPRLSRTADPAVLGELVERRTRLLLGLGAPVIVGLLAAGPWLIEVLYTSEFSPAYDVLQWQLVGDLLRLPAWVFVFVLLTRGRAGGYVGAEIIGGVAVLAASLLGLVTIGLEGAGVGYAASQLVYYGGAWWLVRRHVATTPGRLQAVVLATALIAAGILVSPLEAASRSIIFGISAAALAVLAWPRLFRLHRRGEL